LPRLILFLLIVYIIYSLLKAYSSSRKANSGQQQQRFSADAEEMVFDPQCKSYVPKKDAVVQAGNFFCSKECAQLYLSR
jgi:hypothetical protein